MNHNNKALFMGIPFEGRGQPTPARLSHHQWGFDDPAGCGGNYCSWNGETGSGTVDWGDSGLQLDFAGCPCVSFNCVKEKHGGGED